MQIYGYLSFNGQCAEAFKFYERCFKGKIEMMMTHGESPIANEVPKEWSNLVMHVRLSTGDGVLMGGDAPGGRYEKPTGFCMSLMVDKPAEAERIFRELSETGSVQMPIQQTFWAERVGMATDRFGIPWMVNCPGNVSVG